ncbi:class I SAM-dependent methyltransferase [Streptomyces noursei]|uniref:class I SAM-dependent methyltransferase n=1 Tax=Streptomyces noursei TaxID=1971 RepID=UPI0019640C72|nr:class I SAM-dependent methyltransferase [Streptomyces noursei]QRX90565.1 class I SAM-dependent methyltransferase [Streptomyces noursei]
MTSAVAQLYETFPFPSPAEDAPLMDMVADQLPFVLRDGDDLDGWEVLDAGCGTGSILVALARRYPKARFTGVDACRRSLDIARRCAERHGVTNVELVHGTMPELSLQRRFDMAVCCGVLHHLPSPRAGLQWLTEHLTDDGLIYLWLYDAVGEHGRMLDRELVQLLTSPDNPEGGLTTIRDLGLELSLADYGFPVGWTGTALTTAEQDVADADAYLNPVVLPMRFADMPELFAGLPLTWLAADRVFHPGGIGLVDLAGTETGNGGAVFVRPEDLFDRPGLRERVRELGNLDRLRAIELRLRPTGFEVLAGRGAGLDRCLPRIAGNLLPYGDGPEPGAR